MGNGKVNTLVVLLVTFGMGAGFSLGYLLGALEIFNRTRRPSGALVDRWTDIVLYAGVSFAACIVMEVIFFLAFVSK